MTSKDRRIVFVCHTAAGESLRSARALAKLKDVVLFGISQGPVSIANRDVFAALLTVSDVHDPQQLLAAARSLMRDHGALLKLVTVQETLLLPVAQVNEALDLPAMSSRSVRRTLDKSLLKATLKRAGVTTPSDQLISSDGDARSFVDQVGFPLILKPLTGSGALTTFRIEGESQLSQALRLLQPSATRPAIAESFVNGQELCFDTITIACEPRHYSICEYDAPILSAIEDPARQWRCVMPRDLDSDDYKDFVSQGLAAVRALAVGDAFTHMEGFRNGSAVTGFIDATLRPAGARIAPMFGFACDVDPYFVWARVTADGCFDGPLNRKYAVGTVFLRGVGSGLVTNVAGVESVAEQVGTMLVEAHWPRVGLRKSPTYTGDGFVTVRHENLDEVRNALALIEKTLKISYTSPDPEAGVENPESLWAERLRNYQSLNKPAWEAIL